MITEIDFQDYAGGPEIVAVAGTGKSERHSNTTVKTLEELADNVIDAKIVITLAKIYNVLCRLHKIIDREIFGIPTSRFPSDYREISEKTMQGVMKSIVPDYLALGVGLKYAEDGEQRKANSILYISVDDLNSHQQPLPSQN